MSNPLRFLFENQLIGSEMTAENNALTSPYNVLTEQRSRILRSRKDTAVNVLTQIIRVNRADRNHVADCFTIAQHNLDGVDSFRVRLFADENQQGDVTYDSREERAATLIPMGDWIPGVNYWGETYSPAGLDRISTLWFDAVSWRSALITITTNNNPAGYIDIGMMMMGLSVQPERNFNWGSAISWQSDITLTRTQGGSLMSERGMLGHREMSLKLGSMTDSDRSILGTECRKHVGKPLLVSAYPSSSNEVRKKEYTMIAKLVTGSDWLHTGVMNNEHEFNFLEV